MDSIIERQFDALPMEDKIQRLSKELLTLLNDQRNLLNFCIENKNYEGWQEVLNKPIEIFDPQVNLQEMICCCPNEAYKRLPIYEMTKNFSMLIPEVKDTDYHKIIEDNYRESHQKEQKDYKIQELQLLIDARDRLKEKKHKAILITIQQIIDATSKVIAKLAIIELSLWRESSKNVFPSYEHLSCYQKHLISSEVADLIYQKIRTIERTGMFAKYKKKIVI